MTSFVVEPLTREHIRAVYPLIRQVIPALDLSAWVRFARGATGPRRVPRNGIVVARREGHDYPSGLFCYRVERDPTGHRVLVAEHFVAVDLLHPEAVLAALAGELDALGERLGCGAVRSIVRRPEVEGELTQAGHEAVGSLLSKTLARTGAVSSPGGLA